MALLEARQLTMRFGGLTAVKQVDFTIEKATIASLIGPNGAGKTTTMKILRNEYINWPAQPSHREVGWR